MFCLNIKGHVWPEMTDRLALPQQWDTWMMRQSVLLYQQCLRVTQKHWTSWYQLFLSFSTHSCLSFRLRRKIQERLIWTRRIVSNLPRLIRGTRDFPFVAALPLGLIRGIWRPVSLRLDSLIVLQDVNRSWRGFYSVPPPLFHSWCVLFHRTSLRLHCVLIYLSTCFQCVVIKCHHTSYWCECNDALWSGQIDIAKL